MIDVQTEAQKGLNSRAGVGKFNLKYNMQC
jgi:hypothetical protein